MAKSTLSLDQLTSLAARGAAAAIAELEAQIAAIKRAFPTLAKREAGRRAPTAATARRTRSRWRMSPAARKAVSTRMKKYWAARRAEKAKAQGRRRGAPRA